MVCRNSVSMCSSVSFRNFCVVRFVSIWVYTMYRMRTEITFDLPPPPVPLGGLLLLLPYPCPNGRYLSPCFLLWGLFGGNLSLVYYQVLFSIFQSSSSFLAQSVVLPSVALSHPPPSPQGYLCSPVLVPSVFCLSL